MLILIPLLDTLIVYFGIGLTITASQFFYFYLINVLVAMSASSLGYFISGLFQRAEDAVGFVPMLLLPLGIVGGFVSSPKNQPDWISWFQYVSPIRYGMEALIINEFGSRDYGPEDVDFVEFIGFELGFWQSIALLTSTIVVFRVVSMLTFYKMVRKFQ